jgi:hypothetical protein
VRCRRGHVPRLRRHQERHSPGPAVLSVPSVPERRFHAHAEVVVSTKSVVLTFFTVRKLAPSLKCNMFWNYELVLPGTKRAKLNIACVVPFSRHMDPV